MVAPPSRAAVAVAAVAVAVVVAAAAATAAAVVAAPVATAGLARPSAAGGVCEIFRRGSLLWVLRRRCDLACAGFWVLRTALLWPLGAKICPALASGCCDLACAGLWLLRSALRWPFWVPPWRPLEGPGGSRRPLGASLEASLEASPEAPGGPRRLQGASGGFWGPLWGPLGASPEALRSLWKSQNGSSLATQSVQ